MDRRSFLKSAALGTGSAIAGIGIYEGVMGNDRNQQDSSENAQSESSPQSQDSRYEETEQEPEFIGDGPNAVIQLEPDYELTGLTVEKHGENSAQYKAARWVQDALANYNDEVSQRYFEGENVLDAGNSYVAVTPNQEDSNNYNVEVGVEAVGPYSDLGDYRENLVRRRLNEAVVNMVGPALVSFNGFHDDVRAPDQDSIETINVFLDGAAQNGGSIYAGLDSDTVFDFQDMLDERPSHRFWDRVDGWVSDPDNVVIRDDLK